MKNLKVIKNNELKDWAEEIFKKNSFNMVDVSAKKETHRRALASGKIYVGKDVFNLIRKKNPSQGQYVVNFAYNYPYFMNMNLREATHLIELRTVPQGHPDYRKVAQKMFSSIKKKHPVV